MSTSSFESLFGRRADVTADAPGRVNLIGEHTDYNDGFVLPTPIPQRTRIELSRRDDQRVRAASANVDGDEAIHEYEIGKESRGGTWMDYIQGATRVLTARGRRFPGFEIRISSTVPLGSGLSSSAALEVSLLRAIDRAFELDLDGLEIARLGRRVETDFIGAPIGIMDQMASSLGRAGEALFIDTRTLDYQRLPLPDEIELVVIDSGIAHDHGTGEYRVRREECDRAAKMLQVMKLRDVRLTELSRLRDLPAPLDRRARHVVTENDRVLKAVEALKVKDLIRLGDLFWLSHASMRDDFQVSVPEIDLLVGLARAIPDVYGARMTGGGFGGAVVLLAKRGSGSRVGHTLAAQYRERTQRTATILLPVKDN